VFTCLAVFLVIKFPKSPTMDHWLGKGVVFLFYLSVCYVCYVCVCVCVCMCLVCLVVVCLCVCLFVCLACVSCDSFSTPLELLSGLCTALLTLLSFSCFVIVGSLPLW
jgi:hypothetical protein